MPYFDGTGPFGQGPMTGWGFGPCAGYGRYGRRGGGRGRGRRMGRGMRSEFPMFGGYGYGYPMTPPTKEEEIAEMEEYKKDLKAELEEVDKSLKEIKDEQ